MAGPLRSVRAPSSPGPAPRVCPVLDALALGARHGFDADHLAAISELTAGERGGVAGFLAGTRYAAGHAAAVIAIALVVGEAGIHISAGIIGLTLVGLGVWSGVRLRVAGHTHAHAHVVDGEVVHHSHRHHHAVGVGLVHGLGGAPSAVLAGSRGGLGLAAFAVGLLVANGVVGAVAGATTRIMVLAWLGVVGGVTYGAALVIGAA
jgi:hypothetical protein